MRLRAQMKFVGTLIFILSAIVCSSLLACTSVPKPTTTPEDEAAATRKSRGETYLEICEKACVLPGLFGNEEKIARSNGKVEKSASLAGEIPPEAISSFEAANDFANRHNRAMYILAHPPEPKLAK